MHPKDAAQRGIESGDLVRVVNDTVYVQTGMPVGVLETDLFFDSLLQAGHIRVGRGEFTTVAIVTANIREGVAKASFNFQGVHANAVAHAVPDPMTNNYRYKLGRGSITKIGEAPDKAAVARLALL